MAVHITLCLIHATCASTVLLTLQWMATAALPFIGTLCREGVISHNIGCKTTTEMFILKLSSTSSLHRQQCRNRVRAYCTCLICCDAARVRFVSTHLYWDDIGHWCSIETSQLLLLTQYRIQVLIVARCVTIPYPWFLMDMLIVHQALLAVFGTGWLCSFSSPCLTRLIATTYRNRLLHLHGVNG